MQTYTLSLPPIQIEGASGREREVLDSALKQVGFIPNMYANMVNAPALLETYLHGYRGFREESGLTPAEQEVVFLSISLENGCSYCMAAHSMIAANKSKVPADVIDAIRHDLRIPDPRLRALSAFTRRMVSSRGQPTQSDAEEFVRAGYSERDMLYVILAISVKTLSNYANHVFDTVVDPMFAKHAWQNNETA